MVTISLCIIVKDEEKIRERCLDSIKDIVDEIIIVDTGSHDRTKEIAKKYTDKVFDFQWIDDFSALRNYAFQKATKDYIFWMDADDVLLEEDCEKFKKLKKQLTPDVDAVSMLYHAAFDKYNQPTFSYRRFRLVKREKNFVWKGAVHEYLEVGGRILQSDIAVTHRKVKKENRTDRNLRIYEKRLENGEEFTARDWFYYGNELKDHGQYEKAIEVYEKFLSREDGWVEDKIRACINMAACCKSLGNLEKEIEALVRTIQYDVPRPEVSCRMGDLYLERKLYDKAIMWYQLAIMVDTSKITGFVQTAYATWYPYLQLCVCYWHKGEKELAIECNKKAKEYRPHDSAVLYNEKIFEKYVGA